MNIRQTLMGLSAAAALLPLASAALAQSVTDHAALAHGKPIVNGRHVQPTPKVVSDRLRHHEMMLQAEAAAKAKASSPTPANPKKFPAVDAPAKNGSR